MQTQSGPEVVEFESTMPWPQPATDALVVHCSDHRFQAHFDDFLRSGLHLATFDRLVIPGGPQFLLAPLPKFEWAGRRWLNFLVKHHGIRQLILLAHEDCGWYKDLSVGSITIPLLKEHQITDLRKMPAILRELAPSVSVRLFYARPSRNNRVEFVEVK